MHISLNYFIELCFKTNTGNMSVVRFYYQLENMTIFMTIFYDNFL